MTGRFPSILCKSGCPAVSDDRNTPGHPSTDYERASHLFSQAFRRPVGHMRQRTDVKALEAMMPLLVFPDVHGFIAGNTMPMMNI